MITAHVAIAIRDAMDLLDELFIPAGGEAIGFTCEISADNPHHLIIKTSEGETYRVFVVRDTK